jgi:hypothetical protein
MRAPGSLPKVHTHAVIRLHTTSVQHPGQKDVIMKFSTLSSVKLSAVVASIAVNVAMFLALGAGFGFTAEPAVSFAQLPAVTVYGKRLVDETTPVVPTKTAAAVAPAIDIKL